MKTYQVHKDRLDDTQAAVDRAKAKDRTHDTEAEIAFIKGMAHPSRPRPMHSIKAYRAALEKRQDWTGLDRKRIFGFIDGMLEKASA